MKYRDRVARYIEKREAKWRSGFEQKAAVAIEGHPSEVIITIEGGVGDYIIGPVTTTVSRFEYAVSWFRARDYSLKEHQQGAGAHAWTAVFIKS